MMQCKDCGEIKQRYKRGGTPYFQDEAGKMWNGLSCPTCKAGIEKSIIKPAARSCRFCHKSLPASKYFSHDRCGPQGVEDPMDYACVTRVQRRGLLPYEG